MPVAVEASGMAATLQVQLLGNFRLTYANQPVLGVGTPRLQSLLAYLVLHREAPQPRSHVAALFWPDVSEAQGRNNLRQALHALRMALPNPSVFLVSDTQLVGWRADAPFALDVAEFERAAQEAEVSRQDEGRRGALEHAINLYAAGLLPSCFDEWIAPFREQLHVRHLRLLDQLITLLEATGDYAAAAGCARRMTQHDPLNEHAYRRLIHALARGGDRTGALQVYHACATRLQRELGIAPSPETQDAYERLLRGDDKSATTPSAELSAALAISSSLVGREREWLALLDAWQRARAGSAGFALVTGEAGIGKSRLADELVALASQQDATVARARCYAAEGRLSLAPAIDWLRSPGLHTHLARLNPLWLTEASRVLPELATEFPALPRYEPMSELGQRQRFFESLARAVLAAPQPLLLVIDDLQWCDEETLEWLHFLLRFDPVGRLLVIGTARIEDLSPQHPVQTLLLHLRSSTEVTEVALRALDAAETARLGGMLAHVRLDDAAALRLFRETEGNPLFIVETMRSGFDVRAERDHSGETARPPITSATTLPPRVQAVIAGRLAQLTPAARELVALAATSGRSFRLDVLAHASESDEDGTLGALDELWRKRIVRELGGSTYDFTHDKLREVAYAEISAPQRHLLHRHIAQALQAVYADDLDGVSAQVAWHLERAALGEQAIPFYQRAAAVAELRYAYEDAISLLERALPLLEQIPPGARRDSLELSVLLALAPDYRISYGWTAPELERVIHRALVLCDTVGTDGQLADALYGYASLLTVQARLDLLPLVDEQMRAACSRAHRTPPRQGSLMLTGLRLHSGEITEANEAFELMLDEGDPPPSQDWLDAQGWNSGVLGRAWQSHGLWLLGYPERALRRGTEAVQRAADLELPFNQALAATYLAMLQQLRADPATARRQAEEALQLTTHFKAAYYRAWSSIHVRYAEAWDQPDAVHLDHLRLAIDEFKATGARLRLPYFLLLQARICRQSEQYADGLSALDEALATAQETKERLWDAELQRMRGELLLAYEAQEEAALLAFERAVQIAQSQQARSLELRAATSLARLLGTLGHRQRARESLAEVYTWFSEGHNTPDVRRARAVLARLTEA